MDRIIDADNNNARIFTDGEDLAGIAGTIVLAVWLNGVQQELVGIIEDTGQVPSSNSITQVRAGIQTLGRRPMVFTANGVWVVPNGVFMVKASVVGGGGGGGDAANTTPGGQYSSGAGGGAGGYCVGVYPVTPGQAIPVTVGQGGAHQQPGGTSSFGNFLTAYGGLPGLFTSSVTSTGGLGGGAVGGNLLNVFGSDDSDGQCYGFTGMGNGGAGPFGGGARAASGSVYAGNGPGCGGGAAYGTTAAGAAGAPGIVLVEY